MPCSLREKGSTGHGVEWGDTHLEKGRGKHDLQRHGQEPGGDHLQGKGRTERGTEWCDTHLARGSVELISARVLQAWWRGWLGRDAVQHYRSCFPARGVRPEEGSGAGSQMVAGRCSRLRDEGTGSAQACLAPA